LDTKKTDIGFMAEALKEARKAEKKGEVPVGAVVVHKGAAVARGHNTKETAGDPTAHAELVALKKASRRVGAWRLKGATLYVTLEPCIMCMGAMVQARISRLVFACYDPKGGACGSLYDISKDKRLNHRIKVTSGVSEAEAGELLKGFFSKLRKKKRKKAVK
jgi:tRNA(adenine34) deaminase